jgi:hypothetical protein
MYTRPGLFHALAPTSCDGSLDAAVASCRHGHDRQEQAAAAYATNIEPRKHTKGGPGCDFDSGGSPFFVMTLVLVLCSWRNTGTNDAGSDDTTISVTDARLDWVFGAASAHYKGKPVQGC